MALLKKTAPAPAGVNFGSLDFYVAGGGLPEGNYVWLHMDVRMHSGFGEKKGIPRLGIFIQMLPLDNPVEEAMREQFYSFGSAADKSYAPNAEGTGIAAVPGGPAAKFNNSTNWAMLLKSLYDCGMPEGVFTSDVTPMIGTHVHMTNVPEPEERKGFQNKAATGEATQEDRRPGTVAIVSEILDDGKPWEGTGGIPETTPAKPAAKVNGKVQTIKKTAPPPAPVAEEAAGDEDIQSAAINGISAILEKNPNGCPKLVLRTGTFKAVKDAAGDDMANAVLETFFGDDATLTALLGQVGYTISAGAVKPAA